MQRIDRTEHPTHIGNTEPLSLNERAVFGDSTRCGVTGRVFEMGQGALPREEQTRMFQREAAVAEQRRLAQERQEAEDLQRAAALLAAIKARMERR